MHCRVGQKTLASTVLQVQPSPRYASGERLQQSLTRSLGSCLAAHPHSAPRVPELLTHSASCAPDPSLARRHTHTLTVHCTWSRRQPAPENVKDGCVVQCSHQGAGLGWRMFRLRSRCLATAEMQEPKPEDYGKDQLQTHHGHMDAHSPTMLQQSSH
jgi:hypothetical protein